MAITVLTNASVVYNAVDLSNHVRTVTLDMSAEDVDITAMGATSRTHAVGLRDDRATIEYFQDFAAGSVDATHSALLGNSAGATLVVKPTTAAVSATNPSYTVTAIILTYTPLDGTVGDASMITVEYVPAANSSWVRATA